MTPRCLWERDIKLQKQKYCTPKVEVLHFDVLLVQKLRSEEIFQPDPFVHQVSNSRFLNISSNSLTTENFCLIFLF